MKGWRSASKPMLIFFSYIIVVTRYKYNHILINFYQLKPVLCGQQTCVRNCNGRINEISDTGTRQYGDILQIREKVCGCMHLFSVKCGCMLKKNPAYCYIKLIKPCCSIRLQALNSKYQLINWWCRSRLDVSIVSLSVQVRHTKKPSAKQSEYKTFSETD